MRRLGFSGVKKKNYENSVKQQYQKFDPSKESPGFLPLQKNRSYGSLTNLIKNASSRSLAGSKDQKRFLGKGRNKRGLYGQSQMKKLEQIIREKENCAQIYKGKDKYSALVRKLQDTLENIYQCLTSLRQEANRILQKQQTIIAINSFIIEQINSEINQYAQESVKKVQASLNINSQKHLSNKLQSQSSHGQTINWQDTHKRLVQYKKNFSAMLQGNHTHIVKRIQTQPQTDEPQSVAEFHLIDRQNVQGDYAANIRKSNSIMYSQTSLKFSRERNKQKGDFSTQKLRLSIIDMRAILEGENKPNG